MYYSTTGLLNNTYQKKMATTKYFVTVSVQVGPRENHAPQQHKCFARIAIAASPVLGEIFDEM